MFIETSLDRDLLNGTFKIDHNDIKSLYITPNLETKSITEIVYTQNYDDDYAKFKFPKHKKLDNKIWLFGNDNMLR
jgi:hypothetical protein